jgi:hypothetical protein
MRNTRNPNTTQTQIVPWSNGVGSVFSPLSLALVELLSFVLDAFDLIVWHS